MSEKIMEVDYEQEMSQSYLDYAMSVITERALPDVRDGLKPVQRRILYSLSSLSKPDGPYRKCARVVGDTMGKFHPHGDSSIYEGLVNMAQDFKLPIPLVDPHGNFGLVDGSGASAMRYTEARMSKYTEAVCIKDLSFFKDQFVPNFDNTETEPSVMPFQVPNVLTSGSSGIAVGMATNIPTHNLGEVIDATILYLNNEDCTLDEIMDVLPAPDFSTGGIINASREQLREIYATGQGKIKIRGKVEIRDGEYGRKSICVTEVPYSMIGATSKYLETVAELIKSRELPTSVIDIADRGDKQSECLCVDLKRGTSDEEIENIINILYKKAGLEGTFGVNMRVIDNGSAKLMGILEILKCFCAYKYEVYTTKYTKLLEKQEEIKEIKEGLLRAVDCIDLIIEILRGSQSVSEAKACLVNGDIGKIKFRHAKSKTEAKLLNFTEKQADAILSMRLQKLIGLEVKALKRELADAECLISEYSSILGSKDIMKNKMISDLLEIKKEFAIPRKTKVSDLGEIKIKKAKAVAVDLAVLVDRFSYAKVVERSAYEKNIEAVSRDYKKAILCSSEDRFCAFTDKNSFKVVRIMDIVKAQSKKNVGKKSDGGIFGKLSDKGIPISSVLSLGEDEEMLYVGTVEGLISKEIVFVTRDGNAKLVSGSVYDTSRKESIAYKDGEMMVYIAPCNGTELVLHSNDGYYARFNINDISVKGKGAGCSKLMKLSDKDYIKDAQVGNTKDCYSNKNIPFTKIKPASKGSKGTKMRL